MTISEDLQIEFAPHGPLRVALNHGNRVLVGRDEAHNPVGISVDLARVLAAELGLNVEFVEFDRAVDVSNAAQDDIWDLAFLAVDPARAEVMDFTAPYVRIEGSYLLAPWVQVDDPEDVVSTGLRVATVQGSAYTLHLERQPGPKNLVQKPRIEDALAALDSGTVDAIAGIRQAMEAEAAQRPGTRVIGPFMEIRQAMALPKGRARAREYLKAYLSQEVGSGKLGQILERFGVPQDCVIQPR